MSLKFGDFELDRGRRQLLRRGEPVPLEPKAYELLSLLVERRPRALSHAQVRDAVWLDTFVSDTTLRVVVNALREALGDDARSPRFIRTVRGFGYAFCGEVREETHEEKIRPASSERSGTSGEPHPYPGLAAFSEREAGVFFGREEETAALVEKLQRHGLLALIGPSGAGKTSFVRAGVVPNRPEGWAVVVATPGSSPLRSLARALAPELIADPEALVQLPDFEDPDVAVSLVGRWRRRHAGALVVVDQFEELFTLNPPEVQEAFAALLGRLASEAGVCVLLSLRDDFLIRCHAHAALAPVFQDLTPLLPLTGDDLRRALEEPARRHGYRFEDETLAGEMVEAAEGARTPLPLLAFAVSRLWERRDRDRKVLTRAAYEEIGGVSGALAQHAEKTLERIGPEREPIVRELFRNLVTAQGTRAARTREELLSVFEAVESGKEEAPAGKRAEAETVLQALVDARLLTEYEGSTGTGEGEPHEARVEITHESLLDTWPRLERWQTQDADGAQLRDQLRQAAQLWQEKGRPQDLLWTGTSEREFELWRARYPGRLSSVEEDFARAMVDRARRRKRLRRLAVASAVVGLSVVAGAIAVSRQGEVTARRRAEEEARRAQAARLVALGRVELGRYPTAALAYARRSLELADSPEARRLAVEALWRGPPARILPVDRLARELGTAEDRDFLSRIAISPDGRWLATAERNSRLVHLFPSDGSPARALPRERGEGSVLGFGPRGETLITAGPGQTLRFWSLPDLRPLRSVDLGGVGSSGWVRGGTLLTRTRMSEDASDLLWRGWPLPGGEPEILARGDTPRLDVDVSRTWLTTVRGGTLRVRRLGESPARERALAGDAAGLQRLGFAGRRRLWSFDRARTIRVWSLEEGAAAPERVLETGAFAVLVSDSRGTLLAARAENSSVLVWNLERPAYVAPALLQRPDLSSAHAGVFDPGGRWLATGNGADVTFWPLVGPRAEVLRGGPLGGAGVWRMAFTPDGRWLVAPSVTSPTSWYPLVAGDAPIRVPDEAGLWQVDFHPAGTHVLSTSVGGRLVVAPFAGGPAADLFEAGWAAALTPGVREPFLVAAFDAPRRRVLTAPMRVSAGVSDPAERALRAWDLESGREGRAYSLAHLTDDDWKGFQWMRVAPDGSVFAAGFGGVRRLILPVDPAGTVTSETLYETGPGRAECDLSRDGRRLLAWGTHEAGDLNRYGDLVLFDLARGTSRRLTAHGRPFTGALDPSGRVVVSGGQDGVVRVGPADGGEPHLLFGHEGEVTALAISPDGRWVASASQGSIRLWPMPDVTRPPFHTLPLDELIERLRALTNLEVVPDESAPTGFRLEVGTFPGWDSVPTW